MDSWEYVLVRGALDADKKSGQRLLDQLNDLGAKGWEAVAFQGDVLVGNVLLKRRTD